MLINLNSNGNKVLDKIIKLLDEDKCIFCSEKFRVPIFLMADASFIGMVSPLASLLHKFLLKRVTKQKTISKEFINQIVICHQDCYWKYYSGADGWEIFVEKFLKENKINLKILED